jgi:uncharacterized membrane protein YhfC
MFVPIVFSFLLFIGLIVIFRKKMGVAVKPLVLGSVGFFVFSQILEKALHVVVISHFPNYADHPIWFGLYGGLAAGSFEELGRFILFTWLLKKYRDYKSGISFGIGWGGIEAVLLTLTMVVPNIIFAFMMNAGTLESNIGGQIPAETIQTLRNGVISHGVPYYLLGCVERLFAVFIQIFLSIFVLLGVVKKKLSYILYAISIHAIIDFPLVFFQTGQIKQLWMIELYVALIGCLSFFFIKKLEKSFDNNLT